MVISTVLALAGIALAHVFYGGGYREPAAQVRRGLPRVRSAGARQVPRRRALPALIIRPLRKLALVLFRVVDRVLIDQVLVGGMAAVVDVLGRIVRAFQAGDGQRYMAAFAIGAAGLVFFATRPTCPRV